MIREAKFTSVWDSGNSVITKNCKVNMKTREVFDIEQEDNASVLEGLDILDREYITIDSNNYDVFNKEEANKNDYWYS